MDEYHELLAQHHLRDTTPRRGVFMALLQANAPLSIADLIVLCPTVNRTTIYRTLDVLSKIRIVQVVPVGWKQRYELTSLFKKHHHHLHCVRCGETTEIASPKLEQLVDEIAVKFSFSVQAHTFEITGICRNCQSS